MSRSGRRSRPQPRVREVTGKVVELAFVDRGCTGDHAEVDAAAHGIHPEVVTLPQVKRGFVLLPRRRVVGRGFAWVARSHRLACDS